jgi:transposase InsO family protein
VLSKRFADRHLIPYEPDPESRPLKAFNGSCGGIPQVARQIAIRRGSHVTRETVYVDNISQDLIVPHWYTQLHGTSLENASCSSCSKPPSSEEIEWDDELVLDPNAITIGHIGSIPAEIASASAENPWQDRIPNAYRDFLDLFSPGKASSLPKSSPWDHHIHLKDGAELKPGGLYRLSEHESKVLKDYINKNLREGKIRPSSSPVGAPVLFVPKPNGKLRLCVDYRHLNSVTIKDRTALPLMDELMERVRGFTFITKLDLADGFYLVRIAEGDEWKTAFRTKYGHFEYTVMPFGLCNAPATFQRMMTSILRDLLDEGVVVYLDDIAIYSHGSQEEHETLVKKVLSRLREHNLAIAPHKCSFSLQQVDFLGHRVSQEGVVMIEEKCQAIKDWKFSDKHSPLDNKALPTKHDLQRFIGFINFYRRFIRGFSGIVAPITRMLGKKSVKWETEHQEAFRKLTQAITTPPIMRHFDPSQPAILETDASDFATGGILSQRFESTDGKQRLHPVAFHSQKFSPAELNYDIHDKEMLSIVQCFRKWGHWLASTSTEVYSDHKNLEYFNSTKALNRRQARWAGDLATFDYKIYYKKGSSNKADALSRAPEMRPEKGGIDTTGARFTIVAGISTGANRTRVGWTEISLSSIPQVSFKPSFLDTCRAAYSQEEKDDPDIQWEDGVAYSDENLLRPPASMWEDILRKEHAAAHWGRDKTIELISRNFSIPCLRKKVENLIQKCDPCQRYKNRTHKKYGLLNPLELATAPWTSISMDFIVKLPKTKTGNEHIWVIVDRFSKMAHFIPIKNTRAEGLVPIFLKEIWRLHGIPEQIVSDRDTRFTGSYWQSFCELINTKTKLSTAFHPETDGQTERVNQILEQFLRLFVSNHPEWDELLPLAEFEYNNSRHSSTQMSPFFINYGFHPRDKWPVETPVRNPASQAYVHFLSGIHQQVTTNLEEARKAMLARETRNSHGKQHPEFKVGDEALVSTRNMGREKLGERFAGPFRISWVGRRACKLEGLPAGYHPVFHVSLLEPYHRGPEAPPPVQLPPLLPGQEHHTPESIIRWGVNDDGKTPQFLVKWKGWPISDSTWEPIDSLIPGSENLLHNFYDGSPDCPRDPRITPRKRPLEPPRLPTNHSKRLRNHSSR